MRIRFCGFGCLDTSTAQITVALHKAGSNDALNVTGLDPNNAAASGVDRPRALSLEHEEVPGVITAVTYSIRVGPSAGTARMNGTSAARRYGGAARSTLILEEIVA